MGEWRRVSRLVGEWRRWSCLDGQVENGDAAAWWAGGGWVERPGWAMGETPLRASGGWALDGLRD